MSKDRFYNFVFLILMVYIVIITVFLVKTDINYNKLLNKYEFEVMNNECD